MSHVFKKIKGYSRYLIYEDGCVFDTRLNRFIKPIFKKGYYAISLVGDQGVRKNISRHRLVALAFIFNDEPTNKVHVNHKDGVKGNDHYSNLEWTTASRNRQHAIDNNLAVVNKNVLVIDDCNEEIFYPSIKSVATDFKISYSKLKRLLADEDIVVINSITIKLINSNNNNGKTKVVWRNLITGDSCEFDSIKTASDKTGVTLHSIHNRLAYPEGLIHKDGNQFIRKREFKGWKYIPNFDKVYHENSWVKSVLLKWLDTDEVISFSTQTEISKFLDVSISKISEALSDDKQLLVKCKGRYGLLKRKSSTKNWKKINNPHLEYSKQQGFKLVVVTDKNDNKQFFSSAKECADTFNLNATTLNWRLKKPNVYYDGHTFNYLNT